MSKTPLQTIDIDNIILNENAYFFKLKNRLTKSSILKFFKLSLEDKKNASRKYQPKIREPFLDGNREIAKYSLDIFEFKTKPSFLKKPEQGKWEVKYGIFLIVEYSNYISVLKKYVSGISNLKSYIEPIDYTVLSHFVISQESKIEKIVASSMNTASNALQRKISEATDLKGIYSRFGASKQILNSIRVDNKGKKVTVMLNTSRINSFDLKQDFNDTIFWIVDVLRLIDRAYKNLPQSPFIDGFATPIKFESIIDTLTPTYLLLRFSDLKDDIEDDFIEKCYTKEGKKESDYDLQSLINNNERLHSLTEVSDNLYSNGQFYAKINKSSITIRNDEFEGIYLRYEGGFETTLNQYINSGNQFIINFDKVEYVYSHRKIFRDNRLLGDIENFLSAFVDDKKLNIINSEKGLDYTEESTSFDSYSLFGFIENELANDAEILICDDMGTEWGDFIAIYNNEICFYHAKFENQGLSAKKLEVVLGQAAKNFGNLELDMEMIDFRRSKWQNTFQINNIKTKIKRVKFRNQPESKDIISEIKNKVERASTNPNLRRKVFIVINFLSKSELKNSIELVRLGKNFSNKGVVLQILWFVNSLLSNANELNTDLRIICRP